ncbi:MAG TPA: hypothetical protein VLA66_14070 [Thermoanaerobaculia bacterium]|nr:hypothetical protein [Thermoanaerobaculia bacterium]
MIAGALLAILLLAAVGLGVVELTGAGRGRSPGARLVMALPLGLVAQAALAPVSLRLGLAPGPLPAALLAAALGGAALLARRRRPADARETTLAAPVSGSLRFAAASLALPLLLVALTAALEPVVEWDVVAIWGLKAHWLASGAGLAPFADPAFASAHPDYPIGWPAALALDPTWAGEPAWRASRLPGVALLAAAAGLAAIWARPAGRRAALLAASLVATLPIAAAQAARGLADLPLATLLLLAAGALDRWCTAGDRASLRVGAFALAGLPLITQEGIALALALALVTLARTPRARRRRSLATLVATLGAISLPWWLLALGLPAGRSPAPAELTPARLLAGLDRLPELVRALPEYLLAPADWGALWPLVAIGLALALFRPRGDLGLALFLLAPLPFYAAATLAVDYPVDRLVEVTLSRLALHFALLGAVVAARGAARSGALGTTSAPADAA